MAYEHSAAKRIQSAETVSPRTRARTVQQTAPTAATAPQISTDFSDRPPVVWSDGLLPPASPLVIVPAIEGSLAPLSAPRRRLSVRSIGSRPRARCPADHVLGTVVGSPGRRPPPCAYCDGCSWP